MNYSISHAREDMSKLSLEEPLRDRMLKVAAIITKYMEEKVTHTSDLPIIVGGLAMEVYTSSKYVTRDIDLVSTASIKLEEFLLELGFEKERIYIYSPLKIAVDIVDEVMDPQNYEGINKLEIEDSKHVYIISKEDILYNRALDYTYEDNKIFSIYLMANSPDDINFEQVKSNLKKADPEALATFEEWVKIALQK